MCSLVTGDTDVIFSLYGTRSEFYSFTNSFLKEYCHSEVRVSSMAILERFPPRKEENNWPYRIERPVWLPRDWQAPKGTLLEKLPEK